MSKLISIELVMASSHHILCCPLLLLSPIPPSIRVFPNESTLLMRWSKYWSFSFNISPSKEHPGLISFRMDWLNFLAVQGLSDYQQIQILKLDLLNFNYLCNSFPPSPGSDIISCKRPVSKYLRLSRPTVSVTTAHPWRTKMAMGWCVTEWACICSNIILFTIRGHEMDLPHKPYFIDLCSLLWPFWGLKSLQMVITAMKLKDAKSLEGRPT